MNKPRQSNNNTKNEIPTSKKENKIKDYIKYKKQDLKREEPIPFKYKNSDGNIETYNYKRDPKRK